MIHLDLLDQETNLKANTFLASVVKNWDLQMKYGEKNFRTRSPYKMERYHHNTILRDVYIYIYIAEY